MLARQGLLRQEELLHVVGLHFAGLLLLQALSRLIGHMLQPVESVLHPPLVLARPRAVGHVVAIDEDGVGGALLHDAASQKLLLRNCQLGKTWHKLVGGPRRRQPASAHETREA